MTNWLVGTTDRFKAAVSENGVTNQVADWADSDSGPEYSRAARLGDPVVTGWCRAPVATVAAALRGGRPDASPDAPGEADRRCPAADNEQFFIALRHLGRTVEYILYPDEYHVFASAGRPDRRIDRNRRVLDWFDRFLA